MISYVIPCYQSEMTIEGVVAEVISVSEKNGIDDYEIILCDDCSPDGVWNTICDLSNKNIRVRGISLLKNSGQVIALLAGYAQAKGELIVSLDDDGQTPVDELPALLAKLEEGYDVVYAYYDDIKQNRFRRFGSFMACKMAEIFINAPKGFKCGSFCVVRKYIVDEMIKYEYPYPYMLGLVFRTTKNVTTVRVAQRERQAGRSGYNIKSLLALYVNGLTSFSIKPLRIGTYAGVLFSVIGILYAICIMILKLSRPEMTIGWSSIMSAVLVMGGLILAMLGIIGEYIGRIYMCINHPPQYVIKQTTES